MVSKETQNNLCRGLRACGFSHSVSYQVMNEFTNWIRHNGEEWALDRMKGYHLWYLRHLAQEDHIIPPWYRKTSDGLPIGIFGHIFRTKNQQKVLAMLSCYTVLKNKTVSQTQMNKFRAGVEPSGMRPTRNTLDDIPLSGRRVFPNLFPSFPALDCITGKSIPVSTSCRGAAAKKKVHIQGPMDRIEGYIESWKSVPWETLSFLKDSYPHYVPPAYGAMEPMTIMSVTNRPVGQISVLQEPGLKARWIANPNRITQHFLGPLGAHWYSLLERTTTDCTYDQESGVEWCQNQLQKGVKLSGVDMTSATDLLDRDLCVELVFRSYLKSSFNEMIQDPQLTRRAQQYVKHVRHFLNVSSGRWSFPEHYQFGVSWKQGQPLGTYPSFALLGLTNNALGKEACRRSGIPEDSFRVIGDDIIMDTRAVAHYTSLVEKIGGLTNPTKTLTSKNIAEFAGRIVTPHRVMNKSVKYQDMSDDSFMSVMSNLGHQAVSLLKPRQKKMWNQYKYVPGIVVPGPWSKESFGIPLADRYFWYLHHSGLNVREDSAPDKKVRFDDDFANNIIYHLWSEDRKEEISYVIPPLYGVDFQSTHESQLTVKSRDPRKSRLNGRTLVQVLESASSSLQFTKFGNMAPMDFELDDIEELISNVDLTATVSDAPVKDTPDIISFSSSFNSRTEKDPDPEVTSPLIKEECPDLRSDLLSFCDVDPDDIQIVLDDLETNNAIEKPN